MAVKKAVAKKKVIPKKKAAPARKAVARTSRGDTYECGVCGLMVTVDETCDCAEVCDIICCGKPMKAKKAKAVAKKR